MAINCDAAYERLLQADPVELAGRSDSELASHVRTCPRCEAVAEQLLAGQVQLANALAELGPRTDVGDALSAVRARRRAVSKWELVRGWAPIAAAAAIAAMMVLQSVGGGAMMEGEVAPLRAAIEPLVEAPATQNVMVFETSDKAAKVIWFY